MSTMGNVDSLNYCKCSVCAFVTLDSGLPCPAAGRAAGGATFLALLVLFGCGGVPDPPSRAEVLRTFESSSSPALANQLATEFDLYIDDSMSMRGYVSAPSSHYIRVMNHI